MRSKLFLTVLLLPILQTTTTSVDELNENLNFITNNVLRRYISVKDDLDSYLAIFENYETKAYSKVKSDVNFETEKYLTLITDLFNALTLRDGYNEDSYNAIVSLCNNDFDEKILALQDETIEKIQTKTDSVVREEVVKLSQAVDVLKGTTVQLTDISDKIANCSTDLCATDLDPELTKVYLTLLKEVDFRELFNEIDYLSTFAPTFLITYEADISEYEQSLLINFYNEINICIEEAKEDGW